MKFLKRMNKLNYLQKVIPDAYFSDILNNKRKDMNMNNQYLIFIETVKAFNVFISN